MQGAMERTLRQQGASLGGPGGSEDLTHLGHRSLAADKRLDAKLEALNFGVLPELLEVGGTFRHEPEEAKTKAKSFSEDRQRRKRRPAGESLRKRYSL